MNSNRTVLTYRDTLLFPSETFIRSQTESLSRFDPKYVCLRCTTGSNVLESRLNVLCEPGLRGKVQRARFKLLGPSLRQSRRVAALNPILIHAHFGPDACEAMPLAQAQKIPLVVSLHGYDVTCHDENLPPLYLRRRDQLKIKAARFICVSEFIRNQAVTKGFAAEKAVVHYTGIDTEYFHRNPNIPRSPIVLFVGRLVPMKGCEYLIRAMVRVQQTMPEARLVVIGEGCLREELEQLASALLRNFDFLGVQPPAIVREWMNRASVFSTPSIVADSGEAEGFGMVFAEAQAMELPVVGFATTCIPEVVANDHTGFLLPERDCEALASKLLLLLQNQDMRGRFSEAARRRVENLFNIRKQATILENIYECVLTEWTGPRRFRS